MIAHCLGFVGARVLGDIVLYYGSGDTSSVCLCVCVHVHVLMHAGTHGAKSRSGGVCRIRVFTHEMLAADAR